MINAKFLPEARRSALVEDTERGLRGEINPHPWQTDTCLGQWHYSRPVYEKNEYKSAGLVIHFLCDIVAKNGNLLLSVPVRRDGTIDEKETAIVEGIAGWMGRFSDAIYGTRPWKIAGEGPTQVAGGAFGEEKLKSFSAADIRFTAKNGALYAITLGRPEKSVTINALKGAKVKRVEMAGSTAPLTFRQSAEGLVVTVPDAASHDYGVALKIMGEGLV